MLALFVVGRDSGEPTGKVYRFCSVDCRDMFQYITDENLKSGESEIWYSSLKCANCKRKIKKEVEPKLKITATLCKGSDLKPGDLFSTVGNNYWSTVHKRKSIGECVYIRTETSATNAIDYDSEIYRITIKT